MNSVIEAQETFNLDICFGDLSLRHLCNDRLIVPKNMPQHEELENFLTGHNRPNYPKSSEGDQLNPGLGPIKLEYAKADYMFISVYQFFFEKQTIKFR